ncbi:MAG: RtcB family protein [Myxococcota bacterium]
MPVSLKRLARAMARDGLHVRRERGAWHFQRIDDPDISAEVLMPDGFAVENRAVHQLMGFAAAAHPDGGRVHRTIATPDFHPGSVVPVGAVVETSSDMVIPQAVGTDINCGMRLHTVDLDLAGFSARRDDFVERVKRDLLLGARDLPMTPAAMNGMFRHGLMGWLDAIRARPIGDLARSDISQLEAEIERSYRLGSEEGDPKWAPESLRTADRETLRDSYLATVGGGNHFVEIQVVEAILDGPTAWAWGVRPGQIAVMVHTGSRGVGRAIGRRWIEHARVSWPTAHRRPVSGITPLSGDAARDYIEAMWTAANYGAVNRMLIAELVRLRMREVYGPNLSGDLIFDAPHNLIFEENGRWVHRKGATPAHQGDPVLIPGSMGHPSYLLRGLGCERFLSSASHGAGRALSRHEMFLKDRDGEDLGLTDVCCITLKEERRIQEAPAAYKPIQPVIDAQVEAGVAAPVARMRPLLTFKA